MKKNDDMTFTQSILESVRDYYTDEKNYLNEEVLNDDMTENNKTPFKDVEYHPGFILYHGKDGCSPEDVKQAAHDATVKTVQRYNNDKEDEEQQNWFNNRFQDPEYRDKSREYWEKRREMDFPHGFNPRQTRMEFPDTLEENTDETDMYNTGENTKPDTAAFAAKGMGQIHENNNKKSNKMKKTLNESEFKSMIANMTKQVLKESFGLDPEVGEDEYAETQDYLKGPDGDGMMVDDLPTAGDDTEEFYNDFFAENPAEESFPTTDDDFETNTEEDEFDEDHPNLQHLGWPYDSGRDLEYDQLLESKNKVDMEEKQNKLLTFITENWDNHANNLIK